MATLLFLLLLTVFLAALGRSAIPRTERLPWWSWTVRDLTANVVRGEQVLVELDQRRRRLWDLALTNNGAGTASQAAAHPGQNADERC